MMCADLVDVKWQDKLGTSRKTIANLEDISASGACLQVDEELPLGTSVEIAYPDGELVGETPAAVDILPDALTLLAPPEFGR